MLEGNNLFSLADLPEITYKVRRLQVSWLRPKNPGDHNHVLHFQFVFDTGRAASGEEARKWADQAFRLVREQPSYLAFLGLLSNLLRGKKSPKETSTLLGEVVRDRMFKSLLGSLVKVSQPLSSANIYNIFNYNRKVSFYLPSLSVLINDQDIPRSLAIATREFVRRLSKWGLEPGAGDVVESVSSSATESKSLDLAGENGHAEILVRHSLVLSKPDGVDLLYLLQVAKCLEDLKLKDLCKRHIKVKDVSPKKGSNRHVEQIDFVLDLDVHDRDQELDLLVSQLPQIKAKLLGVVFKVILNYSSNHSDGGDGFYSIQDHTTFACVLDQSHARSSLQSHVFTKWITNKKPQTNFALVKEISPDEKTKSLSKFMDLVWYKNRYSSYFPKSIKLAVGGRLVPVLELEKALGGFSVSKTLIEKLIGRRASNHLEPFFSSFGIERVRIFAVHYFEHMLDGDDYDGIVFHWGGTLFVDLLFRGDLVPLIRDRVESRVMFIVVK